ncbi:MAG: SDR family oxidoreductase [Sphingomonadales bacterium]|nr:SDR family oxidoreductase [Sphingomonadales bacterium]
MTLFSLAGRTALVTGGGQAIGAEVARVLAAQGAAVIVNDVVAERAAAQVARIGGEGGRAAAAVFDVTDLAAARAGIAVAEAELGTAIDILVHNAGNGGAAGKLPMAPFAELPPEVWHRPIDVSLYGAMNCTHVVLPGMIARGHGRIVMIASTAGTHGVNAGMAHYGAAKGGEIGFMRHIAMENARHGVTANALALGLVREGDDPEIVRLGKGIPVGRRGLPADVAPLCLYMVSDEAGWFTGQTVQLNGGVFTT